MKLPLPKKPPSSWANTIHHCWSRCLLFAAILIVSVAVFFTVVQQLTPLLGHYRQHIAHWVSNMVGREVTVGQMTAGWHGLQPVLKLNDVTLHNNHHQPQARLQTMELSVDLWHSLLSRSLRLGSVNLHVSTLKIIQQSSQKQGQQRGQQWSHQWILYAGAAEPFAMKNTEAKHSNHWLQWLLKMEHLRIDLDQFLLQPNKGGEFVAEHVTIYLHNHLKHHQVWGQASIHHHPLTFNTRLQGDLNQWSKVNAAIYVAGSQLSLHQLQTLPMPKLLARTSALPALKGTINLQTWLSIKQGRLAELQSQVETQQVSMAQGQQWRKVPDFTASGRVTHLDHQWQLTTGLTPNNPNLPPTQLRIIWPEQTNQAQAQTQPIRLYANQFPASWLQLGLAGKLTSQGQFEQVYGEWFSGQQWHLISEVKNVTLTSPAGWQWGPLSGQIYLSPSQAAMQLRSQPISFIWPEQLPNALTFQPLQSEILAFVDQGTLYAQLKPTVWQNTQLDFKANALLIMPLADPKKLWLAFQLDSQPFAVRLIKDYLPKAMQRHPHTDTFLRQGFLAGEAKAHLQFEGYVFQQPFHDPSTIFAANIEATGVDLNYKPGWPILKQLTGQVNFDQHAMTIDITSGQIHGLTIQQASAVMPYVSSQEMPYLTVQAKSKGTLSNGIDFINQSPLKHKLGKIVNPLKLQGDMGLNLNLKIPLKPTPEPAQVKGTLITNNADLMVPKWHLHFSQLQGQLAFDNHSLFARDIRGQFLGQPMSVDITTLPETHHQRLTQISLSGGFDMDRLHQPTFAAWQPMTSQLRGQIHYQARLQLYKNPQQKDNLHIQTDLKGLESQLPAPFAKTTTQRRLAQMHVVFNPNHTLEVHAALGKQVQGVAIFASQFKTPHFINGHLAIGGGKAISQSRPGLLVTGQLKQFDWQQWQGLLKPKSTMDTSHQPPRQSGWLRAVSVVIQHLQWHHYGFADVKLGLHRIAQRWQLQLDGPHIKGAVALPTAGKANFYGRFQHLVLQSHSKATSGLSTKISAEDIPSLDVKIQGLQLGHLNVGKTHIVTHRTQHGVNFTQLNAESPEFLLHAKGHWNQQGQQHSSMLTGTLKAQDLAKVFKALGYPSALQAKQVESQFRLFWHAPFFQPSWAGLQGDFHLQTQAGVIQDLGSKASDSLATGRLLTFLSLRSLQKRLTLNFNDLNQKGFSFERLKGDFSIHQGIAETQNLAISGIVAKINIQGSLWLAAKELDLYVEVIPQVTASLPVIAALAGGPIVGAATWVANKIISPELNKIAVRYFHITQSWKHPKITQVER